MILDNKINIIWFGRGNLKVAGDCEPFNLEEMIEGVGPSNEIEEVYRVQSAADKSSAWQVWTAEGFEESKTQSFTKLECGHLYIVILKDGKSIDIKEALVADGGDTGTISIDDDALIITPNNQTPTPTPIDEVESTECLPVDEYKIYSKSGTNASPTIVNGQESYGIDGNLNTSVIKIGLENGKTFEENGSNNQTAQVAFTIEGQEFLKVTASIADGVYARLEINASDVTSLVGKCFEGTSNGNIIALTEINKDVDVEEMPEADLLSAPTDFTTELLNSNQIKCTWTSVTNATGYEIVLTGPNGDTTETINNEDAISHTFTNLSDGDYSAKIRVKNSDGKYGSNSASTSSITIDTTGPSAPNLTLTTANDSDIVCSWQAIDDAESYHIKLGDTDEVVKTKDELTHTFAGNADGAYTVTIYAKDAEGNSGSTSSKDITISTIVTEEVCFAPETLNDGQYRLRFTKPESGTVSIDNFSLGKYTNNAFVNVELTSTSDDVTGQVVADWVGQAIDSSNSGVFLVNFALVFSSTESSSSSFNPATVYPSETVGEVAQGSLLMAMGATATGISATDIRCFVYDTNRKDPDNALKSSPCVELELSGGVLQGKELI